MNEIKNIMISSRKDVKQFLLDMNNILTDDEFDANRDFVLIRSDKKEYPLYSTKYTLLDLEYDIDDVIDRIKELTIHDYSETLIDRDCDRPPLLFVFGKDIDGREIYIKLKNKVRDNGDGYVLCVSFHYARMTMNHPYR